MKKEHEMSVKESSVLNWYWLNLCAECAKTGRQVSAGQVAKAMGVSRATAQKYLKKVVKGGKAMSVKITLKTGIRATYYSASGGLSDDNRN